MGATILDGYLPDGSYGSTFNGEGIGAMCMLGTFSQYATIRQESVVKVDEDLPLEVAVLCGCGVPTGWGSAVNTGNVQIGDTVIIFGIGGIGANAVQGASHAGATRIIAVDPLPNKGEFAQEMGATHAVTTAEEGIELAQQNAAGGADVAIVTVDVVNEQVVQAAAMSLRKNGTLVITGLAHPEALTVHLSGADLVLNRKHVKGSLFGDCNPAYDITKMLDPLSRRQAQARRARHQAVQAVRDQRGLCRSRGRQEHPRGHHPRALRSCDFISRQMSTRSSWVSAARRRSSPSRWRRAATRCSRDRRAPASRRCSASIAAASGRGVQFVEGNAELTPARLIGSHDPALVLDGGYTPEAWTDGPLVIAMRSGELLYLEELNRIPEETLNVLITAMAEREIVVPRLGRIAAADGFVLVAAMNPFDAIGTARVSQSIADRMCRIAIGYLDEPQEREVVERQTRRRRTRGGASRCRSRAAAAPIPRCAIGSSVRGAIDMVRLASGSRPSAPSPQTDRELLLDAAIAAMSGRVRVHEDQSRTAEEVIAQLLDAALASEDRDRASLPPAEPTQAGADHAPGPQAARSARRP